MKLCSSNLILAVILLAGILVFSIEAQSGASRPPGVPVENWIAITESAGIVIRSVPRTPPRFRFDPNQPGVPIPMPPGAAAIPGDLPSMAGVLMAKHGDVWVRIEMPMPPAQLHPLDH